MRVGKVLGLCGAAVLSLGGLASCAATGQAEYDICKADLKDQLKYPDSLKVKEVLAYCDSTKTEFVFTITWDAKNGWGEYGGYENCYYYYTEEDGPASSFEYSNIIFIFVNIAYAEGAIELNVKA